MACSTLLTSIMNPRPDKVYLLVGINHLKVQIKPRTYNVLRYLDANSIFDCLLLGKNRINKAPRCGSKTLAEIEKICEVYGFTLTDKGISKLDLSEKRYLQPEDISSLIDTCLLITECK